MRGSPLAFLVLVACGSAPTYLNRDVTTVGVVPPFNDSMNLDASKKVWPMIEERVAGRGYVLVPKERVEEFYARNKFVFPEEIRAYRNDELANLWGCQALLYTRIEEYGQKYIVFAREVRVRITAELVETRTGEILWRGSGEGKRSSSSESGLGGLLLEAVVHQIVPGELEGLAEEACARALRRLPLAGYDPEK